MDGAIKTNSKVNDVSGEIVKEHYVYFAYGKSGELLYVGKGRGERYKHCLYGASNNKDINRYYFMNGEDGCITVKIVEYFETEKEALDIEKFYITNLFPMFNKDFSDLNRNTPKKDYQQKLKEGKVVDFRVLMQEYISSVKSEDADKVAFLDDNHPMLKLYYEEIGEDKLKALKYRKKDVEDEYSLRKLKNGKFFDVIKNTSVISGDIITVKEAKEAIQNAFLKVNLGGRVTAKTFEEYFIVEPKLVTVQGRRQRAYKVLSPKNVNLLM